MKEILYYEGGEALEQVAQRSCGCRIMGSVQGWGFEQPGLVEGVPAQGRAPETRSLPTQLGPFQLKSFYDSKN